MRARSQVSAVLAISAAVALLVSGAASAAAGHPPGGGRQVLASTAPVSGQVSALRALAPASRVQVSVFTGRDLSGLAALATTVSDPASPRYGHYLTPARVRAEFGATAARQRAVAGWLRRSGLTVTYHDPFVVTATATTARAEAAVRARLELSHPKGGTEQVVPARAMSAPASVAAAISTVRVAPEAIPVGVREPVRSAAASAAAARTQKDCSRYYGQDPARGMPAAYGRHQAWSVCGYLPQQLRSAYGATRAGLTGQGASLAIMSEDNDTTALSDASHWARDRHFPPFKPGQFRAIIARGVPDGYGDGEDGLDVEAAHGMAPGARITYVAGNGKITGDRLLDSLYTIVAHHLADVVTASWFENYMPVPKSMIDAWETVLQRAAVEGITVNTASGDDGYQALAYPSSDPWITAVGGTSLAVGAQGQRLWETGWASDTTFVSKNGHRWHPAPPGPFAFGSTGGVSRAFPEPRYQAGIVSGDNIKGKAMRAVPDVSALGDWWLGYQVGLTVIPLGGKPFYTNQVAGGTSLASPMFAGFEADLIQGRHDRPLGFASPALYKLARTPAFHDVTSDPQGRGVTEADVLGPVSQAELVTMGECASEHAACGRGYDMVTGIGSPGPAFFDSFGSRWK
jgi:subtilase family serine protease